MEAFLYPSGLNIMESQGFKFWTKWHLEFMKFMRWLIDCISCGGSGMDQEEENYLCSNKTSTLLSDPSKYSLLLNECIDVEKIARCATTC